MHDFLNALKDFGKYLIRKENLPQRILSLLLACLLWGYVAVQNNPVTEQTFEVRLNQVNLPTTMTVYNAPQKVSVRVRGSRTVLRNRNDGDITATVDFKNVTEGQQKVPVKIVSSIGEVVSVNPHEISVYVDTISQKTVSVQTRMVGTVPEDMTLGNVLIKPNLVTIKGATHRLSKVNSVVAPVDVTDKTGAFEVETELVAVSDDGYDIPNMVIIPQRVTVSAVLVSQMLTVELPVELVTTGNVPAGMTVKTNLLEPAKVKVSASPSKLKGLTAIKTRPLDVSKLTRGGTPVVELELPEETIADTRVVKAHVSLVSSSDSETQRDSVGDGLMNNTSAKEKKRGAKN